MSSAQRSSVATETLTLALALGSLLNADGTVMNATGGAGKFSRSVGGWGSGTVEILGEVAVGNTKTDDLMATVAVPINFQKAAYPKGDKALSIKLQHKTDPIATTTASVDVQVYISDGNGGVTGSNLATTGAITANTTTWTERVFDVTPTNIEPGMELVILVRCIVDDSVGSNSAQAHIGEIALEYNGKM